MGGCSAAFLKDDKLLLNSVQTLCSKYSFSKQKFPHTVPLPDKSPCEDPHESSQTNQLHSKLFQYSVDGAVELRPARV